MITKNTIKLDINAITRGLSDQTIDTMCHKKRMIWSTKNKNKTQLEIQRKILWATVYYINGYVRSRE